MLIRKLPLLKFTMLLSKRMERYSSCIALGVLARPSFITHFAISFTLRMLLNSYHHHVKYSHTLTGNWRPQKGL